MKAEPSAVQPTPGFSSGDPKPSKLSAFDLADEAPPETWSFNPFSAAFITEQHQVLTDQLKVSELQQTMSLIIKKGGGGGGGVLLRCSKGSAVEPAGPNMQTESFPPTDSVNSLRKRWFIISFTGIQSQKGKKRKKTWVTTACGNPYEWWEGEQSVSMSDNNG